MAIRRLEILTARLEWDEIVVQPQNRSRGRGKLNIHLNTRVYFINT